MHKEWLISYKKVSKSQIKGFIQENIRKFFEVGSLVAYFTNGEYEIVLLMSDQFVQKNYLYFWNLIGASKYVKTKHDTFSMFLLITFSINRLHGVMRWFDSTNSNFLTKFLHYLS